MGYGRISQQTKERQQQHKEQIEKLDALAKIKSKQLYNLFVESLYNEDSAKLSGAEVMAMGAFTGALFTCSVVYALYFDLIKTGLNLEKHYSEQQIEDEIIKAIKSYSKSIRERMKKGSIQ